MKYEKNTNYQYFVNEVLDDVIMVSDKITNYTFFDNNAQFTFETINGKIDFFPTTGKINFRDDKGWQSEGLNKLLKYIEYAKQQACETCPTCGQKINNL